ncbi:MAG: hypothetical protein KBA81_05795 [Rhabdochlamydiaceae bacterium]|nr:hypothetical protein [Rhabdochlamydiaceae bacterium]
MAAETNRTGTKIEALVDLFMGRVLSSLEQVNGLLKTPAISNYVTTTLNNFVWATPLLTAQLAPRVFTGCFLAGGFTGLFSYPTMMKIFEQVDAILSGGDVKNTNFKISVIFALTVVHKISPIPFPSLPRFYAGAAGLAVGIKASTWIPESQAKTFAKSLDKYLRLEPIKPKNGWSSLWGWSPF